MPQIQIPSPLRQYSGKQSSVEVAGKTVGEVLAGLVSQHPDLKRHLYTDDGKLVYAGRVGTGMPVKVLAGLRRRLDPLARKASPLSVPPPRSTRSGR